jgi:hypothetical protein
LATCPEATYRNGGEAVKLASRACDLSRSNDESLCSTLAAAYAEAGQFEHAITWQQKALEVAPPESQAAERARMLLESYQNGVPCRVDNLVTTLSYVVTARGLEPALGRCEHGPAAVTLPPVLPGKKGTP